MNRNKRIYGDPETPNPFKSPIRIPLYVRLPKPGNPIETCSDWIRTKKEEKSRLIPNLQRFYHELEFSDLL